MNPPESTVSAVMAVHGAVAAAHLESAVDSLLAQTRLPDEVVVVEDGPLEEDQLRVLSDLASRHQRVTRLRLPSNQGAGVANQVGLEAAKGQWIAKVDADDISLRHRLERQLAILHVTGADVCGAAVAEFEHDPNLVLGVRANPEQHTAIARRMRLNNPINHPTAVYRRDLAIGVGGYPPFRFMQDYGLFARMLAGGATMVNTNEVLVLFRANDAMFGRRRGRDMSICERDLQHLLVELGVVGRIGRWRNILLRSSFRRLPRYAFKPVHRLLFRRGQPASVVPRS